MTVFYWIAGILLALTALPSAFFFVLYLMSGEDGCQRRDRQLAGELRHRGTGRNGQRTRFSCRVILRKPR